MRSNKSSDLLYKLEKTSKFKDIYIELKFEEHNVLTTKLEIEIEKIIDVFIIKRVCAVYFLSNREKRNDWIIVG